MIKGIGLFILFLLLVWVEIKISHFADWAFFIALIAIGIIVIGALLIEKIRTTFKRVKAK